MQFQRPFVNGFNLVVGYNYNRERNQEFYDEQDVFTNSPTWQRAPNARQRITGATIYEIPVGKGRHFFSSSNKLVDGLLGGWSVSGLFTYNTGLYLRFGGLLVDGDPGVENPTQDRWFDGSKIKQLMPFTRRTNPLQYDSVKGPRYVNMDTTLAKEFKILEKLKFELRGEAYNLMNTFTGGNPDQNVNSPTFGRITTQRGGLFGRQIQYSGRFIW